MSKSKFRSFLQFLGLAEITFNDNQATVTIDQVTEANDRLEAVQQQNTELQKTNSEISAKVDALAAEIMELKTQTGEKDAEIAKLNGEIEKLKQQPGAQPAKVVTGSDPAPVKDTGSAVTSKDKDFMQNMNDFGEEYSFLKR